MTAPNISAFQAKEVGDGLMAGRLRHDGFLVDARGQISAGQGFRARRSSPKNKYYPRWDAHIGYAQTYVWALAVERANSFYPPDVIKALEASKDKPFDSTLGKVWYRAEDHQLVRPVPVLVGKAPSAMKNAEDFYELVEIVPGEAVDAAAGHVRLPSRRLHLSAQRKARRTDA